MHYHNEREESSNIETKEEDRPSVIKFDQALWEIAKANGADAIHQYLHSLDCPYSSKERTHLLYWAAQLGFVHIFIHFAQKRDVKKIAPKALHYAAQGCKISGYEREEESYAALWKYLVQEGFDPSKKEKESKEMPLNRLVQYGYFEMLKNIFPSLPPLSKTVQNYLYSAAVKHRRTTILVFLEAQGITPECFSDDPVGSYLTVLCFAVENQDHETTEYLVEKRGAVEVGKRRNCNPLRTAAKTNNDDLHIFSYLLNKGFDPKEESYHYDEDYGNTVHALAKYGRLKSIQYLLEYTQDKEILTSRDTYGRTPLFAAISHGHLDVVSYLIRQGVNPNGGIFGKDAFTFAGEKGQEEIATFLAPYVAFKKQAPLIEACEAIKQQQLAKEYAKQVTQQVSAFLLIDIARLIGEYTEALPKRSPLIAIQEQLVKLAPNLFFESFRTFQEKIHAQLQEPLRSILSPLLSISPDAQIYITPFFGKLLAHSSRSLYVLQQLQQKQKEEPFLASSEANTSDMEEESKEDHSEASFLKRQQAISACSEAFEESCKRLQARVEEVEKLSLSQSCPQEQNMLRKLLLEDVSILQCTLLSGLSLGKAITPKLDMLLDSLQQAKQILASSSTWMHRAACFIADATGHNKETQKKYLQLMTALIKASDLGSAEKEELEKRYLRGENVAQMASSALHSP